MMKSILNVNKSYGQDEISPRIFKETGLLVPNLHCKNVNASLQLDKFLLCWKRTKVHSYKKRTPNINEKLSHRPLLSILLIFLSIVFKHVFYCVKETLLYPLPSLVFCQGILL